MTCKLLPLLAVTLFTLPSVPLQAADKPAEPCAAETSRQFDFWVGDWTVTEKGKFAGVNRIERSSTAARCWRTGAAPKAALARA